MTLSRSPGPPTLAALVSVLLGCAVGLLLPAAPAAALGALPGAQPAQPAAAAETPPATVDARSDPEQDRAIERRLREIYAAVDGLEGVSVVVGSGVVHLSGEVLSEDSRQRALRIARQIQGVVEVEDSIAEVRDVERRLRPAIDKLRRRAAATVALLPLLAVALLVFVAFWWLGRWLSSLEGPFRRLSANRFVSDLLRLAVRAACVLGGTLLALELLDATAVVAAVAGAAGLAGLALGFAFRDLAENFIASVLLSLRQPFQPNDLVLIAGHEGRVLRLTTRATILITLDGNHVRIPNADVFKGVTVNYSRNPRRRFGFAVAVGVEVDLAAALDLALDVLRRMDGVLDEPPPQGWIDELGDSTVVLRLFAWIDQTRVDWSKARGDAMRRVKEAFDEAGVSMPEPSFNVRLLAAGMEALAAAPEPLPAEAAKDVAERRRAAPEEVPDLSPDTSVERQVTAERSAEGEDLLDPSAPVE